MGALVRLSLLLAFPLALVCGCSRGSAVSDDPPVVRNGPQPFEAAQQVWLEEMWSTRDDHDDGAIFGDPCDVWRAEGDSLYVLDRQLCRVAVFSPQGKLVRWFGQEGDGPGDLRRPQFLLLMPDSSIGVIQPYPGRIVCLDRNGVHVGDCLPRIAASDSTGQPDSLVGAPILIAGRKAGSNLALCLGHQYSSRGLQGQALMIGLFNGEGKLTQSLIERRWVRRRDSGFEELGRGECFRVRLWATGPAGRVFLPECRDRYSIRVFESDGQAARVIEREYERLPFPESQVAHLEELAEGSEGSAAERLRAVADRGFHDDILDLWGMPAGHLWVLSSRGAYELPDTTLAIIDVFDEEGRFKTQLVFPGQPCRETDLYFLGNLLVVVRGRTSMLDRAVARCSSGVDDLREVGDTALEITCYKISLPSESVMARMYVD
jgi:hypothetical protein